MSLYTDQKYVGVLSPRLERFSQVRPNLWNARCCICGDSQKNKSKKRLYIYAKKQDLFVKCHNCGYGASLGNFIKEVDPHLHGQYVLERYSEGNTGSRKTKTPEFKFAPPKFKPKKTTIRLPSIGSLERSHHARIYYESRKMPGSFMDLVFFADDFKKWVNSVCQTKYENLPEKDPRLVIPFFDEQGKLIAAQGRALGAHTGQTRYITVKVHEDAKKIYGLDRWKKDQLTYVVEGPIDSMFIPNCLAIAGGDLTSIQLDKSKTVLIFDNEPRSFHTVQKVRQAIEDGWKVTIFQITAFNQNFKDINDLVMKGVEGMKLLNFINKNTFNDLNAQLELTRWNRM